MRQPGRGRRRGRPCGAPGCICTLAPLLRRNRVIFTLHVLCDPGSESLQDVDLRDYVQCKPVEVTGSLPVVDADVAVRDLFGSRNE